MNKQKKERNKDYKRLYSIWHNMKTRCNNQNSTAYKNYGGRGITVCSEWTMFKLFKAWAFETGYTDELTLERIDNNKGYYPENCKWVSMKEQANNRRNNLIIEAQGVKKTCSQWAEENKINAITLRNRIKNGWNVDEAITKPSRLHFEDKIKIIYNDNKYTLDEASEILGFKYFIDNK